MRSSAIRTTAPATKGDSTSLFKSTNLVDWHYVGPFYKSDRQWTDEIEDCACSNFFPFGDRHMLLMHTHQPYGRAQYYIGRYENERFHPETYGRLSHLGSLLAGPETLLDAKGRRLFWGWIREARDWTDHGWSGVMSLPWHLSPAPDNALRIDPVAELRNLRYDECRHPDLALEPGEERTLHGFESDCMELKLTIHPTQATRFGLKLLCSPGGQEETVVTYDTRRQQLHRRLRPRQPRPESHLRPQPPRHHQCHPPASRPVRPPAQPTPPFRLLHRPLRHRTLRQLPHLHNPTRLPHPPRQSRIQDLHRGPPNHRPGTSSNGKWTSPTPGDPQLPQRPSRRVRRCYISHTLSQARG